jgi:hypothetical protein
MFILSTKEIKRWIFVFPFQPQDPGFHGQEKVYGDLGEEMLEHSFEGKVSSINDVTLDGSMIL